VLPGRLLLAGARHPPGAASDDRRTLSDGTRIHLVDGTWELFRHHFGMPSGIRSREAAAVRAVARSLTGLLESGATHVGVATDHIVESFRNDLWDGYKTGEGIDPHLVAQFPLLEEVVAACGMTVWPMIEFEADDALASAARAAAADPDVALVIICSPDKDLAQCVRGSRVVQWDRRTDETRDEDGVHAHFGVRPAQIPDWLALVGDNADGFPGLKGWGARSAAAVLDAYGSLEAIPDDPAAWSVPVRGAARLAAVLDAERETALLFRRLARLRDDLDVLPDGVAGLRWRGPADGLEEIALKIGAPELAARLAALADGREG
jgi:5'-3' exonuclease